MTINIMIELFKKIRLSEEIILSSEIPSSTKTRSHFDAETFKSFAFSVMKKGKKIFAKC